MSASQSARKRLEELDGKKSEELHSDQCYIGRIGIDMPDAFISYSRKNIAFARLLIQALEENEIQAWIDWQDIPPSADWLAEVYQAIEGSDTFIFIISEHSVISEVCGLEIAHAIKNNKRLIPIVVNEVETSKVPAPLDSLQWIFFKQQDQFSTAIQDLLQAIQIDQDWVKKHTRLQNRALEWDRRQRSYPPLLRGQDLSQAEAWISQASGKDPSPTSLQTEFIFASRKQANRLQRIGIGGAATSIIVAMALGIWAWTQRVDAVQTTQARATAEHMAMQESITRATAEVEAIQEGWAKATAQAVLEDQIQTVSARFLAARANSFARQSSEAEDENLDLGLLLSVEALHLQENLETRTALFTALTAQPYLDRFLFRASGVQFHELLFDPQGHLVVVNYEDQELLIFDLDQGKLLHQIPTPHLIGNIRHDLIKTATQDGVRFNLKGTLMITHAVDRTWILWDTNDYSPVGEPFPENINGRSILSVSPDFSLVATLEENTISIWERESGALIQVLEDLAQEMGKLPVFSNDNKLLIVPSEERTIQVLEVFSGEQIQSFELDPEFDRLIEYEINPQGTRFGAVGSGSIVLYDLTTGKPVTSKSVAEDTGYGLLFSPDGQAYLGYTQYTYNQKHEGYEEYTYSESLGEENLVLSRFAPVSKWYYPTIDHMVSATDPLARMDPGSLRIVTRRSNMDKVELLVFNPRAIYPILKTVSFDRSMDGDNLPQQVVFHPQHANILAVVQCKQLQKSSCELTIGDLAGAPSDPSLTLATKGSVQAVAFHPQGSLLAIAEGDGVLSLWDWQQGIQILELEGLESGITWLGFSSDGKYLVANPQSARDPISIWSPERGEIHSQIPSDPARKGAALHLALHPQQPWLGIAYGDGAVLWDITRQSQIAELGLDESSQIFDRIAFHPAGKHLATGGPDGILIWDIDTLEPLSTFDGSLALGELDFLGYDPTGVWLISGRQGLYALIDSETGKFIGELFPTFMDTLKDQGIYELLPAPTINSDGSRILAYARGNELLFWQLDLEFWEAAACRMANRNLTLPEWKAYMGDEPYRETCP